MTTGEVDLISGLVVAQPSKGWVPQATASENRWTVGIRTLRYSKDSGGILTDKAVYSRCSRAGERGQKLTQMTRSGSLQTHIFTKRHANIPSTRRIGERPPDR